MHLYDFVGSHPKGTAAMSIDTDMPIQAACTKLNYLSSQFGGTPSAHSAERDLVAYTCV